MKILLPWKHIDDYNYGIIYFRALPGFLDFSWSSGALATGDFHRGWVKCNYNEPANCRYNWYSNNHWLNIKNGNISVNAAMMIVDEELRKCGWRLLEPGDKLLVLI